MTDTNNIPIIEQWGVFELQLSASARKNPYHDVHLTALFTSSQRSIKVDGFYDGEGAYRIRCMPDMQGTWHYRTQSTFEALDDIEGTFTCVAPTANNHGPVQISDTLHFRYADGTPYKPLGTTCYAWTHQPELLEQETLATLRVAPFNKVRMCVFPKHYLFNENEPARYPFPCLSRGSSSWSLEQVITGEPSEGWAFDFDHFEPTFFQHLEQRIQDLQAIGIEADLILFHPYDRWGFARMDASTDERYLRYVVARLAAYRNVWWSLANEYDLMQHKSNADWERFSRIIQECDPFGHLRSIHNCLVLYDHSQPWVTHLSVQLPPGTQVEQTQTWREQYHKPVIVDECGYEGTIEPQWGSLTAQEMVHRFWAAIVRGGYVSHGETFPNAQDVLWWAKGGSLHGQSVARLAFLQRILSESPAAGLDPLEDVISPWVGFPCAGQKHSFYLLYFGRHQPAQIRLPLPKGERYQAAIIDTWNMIITPLEEVEQGTIVPLPSLPYQALIMRRLIPTREKEATTRS